MVDLSISLFQVSSAQMDTVLIILDNLIYSIRTIDMQQTFIVTCPVNKSFKVTYFLIVIL